MDSVLNSAVLTKIQHGSVVAQAVHRIGGAIRLGLLRPGDRLPSESSLSEDLGISSVSLRSALAILREAGLVETSRGRRGGTYVSQSAHARRRSIDEDLVIPSESVLRELTDLRCAVEGGAARLAAERISHSHADQLDSLIESMDGLTDFASWGEVDSLFHLVIADAAGCGPLASEIAQLRVRSQAISAACKPVPGRSLVLSNGEHRKIVQAIVSGDGITAETLVIEHVGSTLAFWLGLGLGPRRQLPDDGW